MPVQLPTSGKVQKAKLHKELPGRDGKPPAKVWKVRVGVGDQFVDAELFGGEQPAVGTEVSVEASDYGPKAKRAGGGGFRGGGGGRKSDPQERASIESQVASKNVTELTVAGKATDAERGALEAWNLKHLGGAS